MDQAVFKKKVIPIFTLSIIVSTIGAFIGLLFADVFTNWMVMIGLFIVEIALIVLLYTKFKNLPLLFLFNFIAGLTLTPILVMAVSANPILIPEALIITSIVFVALSGYAYFSKKDFTFLGGILFILLIVGIVASLGVFVASYFTTLDLSLANIAISAFFTLLFSAWVLYDMSSILRHYSNEDYIQAVVSLYIDFINLFVNILFLLIGMNQRD
jgi:FtsH-binding integral membrane protein